MRARAERLLRPVAQSGSASRRWDLDCATGKQTAAGSNGAAAAIASLPDRHSSRLCHYLSDDHGVRGTGDRVCGTGLSPSPSRNMSIAAPAECVWDREPRHAIIVSAHPPPRQSV